MNHVLRVLYLLDCKMYKVISCYLSFKCLISVESSSSVSREESLLVLKIHPK